jgi:hypothetical protein
MRSTPECRSFRQRDPAARWRRGPFADRAALPRIIQLLRPRLRFVPVSTLAGLKRDDVMPGEGLGPGGGAARHRHLLGTGRRAAALNWTFFFAIALGTLRARGPDRAGAVPRTPGGCMPWTIARRASLPPRVTVIIPAYNEERVIEASVHRILASTIRRSK